jgi:hypothetical protein
MGYKHFEKFVLCHIVIILYSLYYEILSLRSG